MATIGEILGISHKMNSMTPAELAQALNAGASKLPSHATELTSAAGLVGAYSVSVNAEALTKQGMTALNNAQQSALLLVPGMNVSVAAQVAGVSAGTVQKAATDVAKSAATGAVSTVLNTEIV